MKQFILAVLVLPLALAVSTVFYQGAEGAGGTPVAVADSLTMYQGGGSVVINWIANDDMDDNATLDSFDSTSTNSGTVADNGNGTFTYTPPTGFSGGDGFTYTICDDDTPTAECSTAPVSITIVAVSACLTGFYQTLSGEINILDTTSSPASYVSVAADLGELNATGYNPNDGLIYGYSSNLQQVVSFDPNTGVFTNVYSHTEDNPFAGDFDSSNNLYYNRSSDTVMYVYNSASDMRTTITLPSSHGASDFAYVPNDDLFYGIQSGGDNAAVIDVSGPTVTTQALSGPITTESGGFGATWVTGNDTLYAFNNDSGRIFSINTTTWVSTLVTTSVPNGSNDGMSCAAGTSPFDISSILDYGDAPDTYGTLLASSGASAVVNTSYRLGNFNEVDADGQPSTDADADDGDDIGDDEDGAFIGITALENQIIYEVESNTVDVSVPLNNGYVSMWIDLNDDGDFLDAGEQVATDVSPTGGTASLTFSVPSTTSVPFDSFARVRLAARTGASATGLYSFGEVEDYDIQIYPSRPTITNNALTPVSATNETSWPVSGVCTDDGDSVVVTVSDGSNPDVTSATLTCGSGTSGTFSTTLDVSSLNDALLTVTSTIDDTYNDPVSDVDTVQKDATPPTIDQSPVPNITGSNNGSYPVSGACSDNGDAITVTLTDSDSPANTAVQATTCSSGTYSVTVDASGLIDGSVNVESSIDDGINTPVTDDEDVTMDTVSPSIMLGALPAVTADNSATYPISGTCANIGDAITVEVTDTAPITIAKAGTCVDDGLGSGEFTVTMDISALDSGLLNVEATINDGVNPEVSDTGSVTVPEDLDNDDTTSEEEKAGPNNGDGNDDGIPDHLQNEVTTKKNTVIDSYVTLAATGTCDDLEAFNFFVEPELISQDDVYDYQLGLHGFTADCSSPGGTVNITYYWDKLYDTSEWNYRKFINGTYIDFNNQVTYGIASVGGINVTTVSFSITDGGPYDADGVENGKIVDPAGPALNLSNTGSSTVTYIAVGASLVLLVPVAAVVSRKTS